MTFDTSAVATQPQETTGPRRARMLRYGLWQMRDYFLERGLHTMIIAALFTFPGVMIVRAMIHGQADDAATVRPGAVIGDGALSATQHAEVLQVALDQIRGITGIIVFLGALLAVQGLASNDRKHGYFRFLFAKPVTPERYYGQAFVVHWLGFTIAFVLLLLLWGWLAVPVISVRLVVAGALLWLCYAGICFLLTAATRWDWLLLAAVAIVSTMLWTRYGTSTSVFARLLWLLPPLTKVDAVYAAAASTHPGPMPWGTLAWLTGYGVACYVAGLFVLHHRRLATP
jgi:hypothetical protein